MCMRKFRYDSSLSNIPLVPAKTIKVHLEGSTGERWQKSTHTFTFLPAWFANFIDNIDAIFNRVAVFRIVLGLGHCKRICFRCNLSPIVPSSCRRYFILFVGKWKVWFNSFRPRKLRIDQLREFIEATQFTPKVR